MASGWAGICLDLPADPCCNLHICNPVTASCLDAACSMSKSFVGDQCSFRGDQTARPRRVASQMGALAWALDLANFENVPVQLHGFEKEHLFMQWSTFLAEVLNIIKVRPWHASESLLLTTCWSQQACQCVLQ